MSGSLAVAARASGPRPEDLAEALLALAPRPREVA